jgi:hypothetical protein
VREVDLVGLELEPARAGAALDIARPQRRLGREVFEVLEDLRRVEDFEIAVDQDRHLLLGVDADDVGVLGAIARAGLVGDHHQLDVERFSSAAISTLAPNMLSGPEYRIGRELAVLIRRSTVPRHRQCGGAVARARGIC